MTQRRWLSYVLFVSCSLLMGGCAVFRSGGSERYDDRDFTVLNLNLFNQRVPSTMSDRNWKGDWLFRRERLELVDEQLRISRPDIAVFQELLTRRGSPSESDINILSYGALEGYEWNAVMVGFYKDTQEIQYQATGVGLPIKLSTIEEKNRDQWPIGMDGFMSHSVLELDQEPIVVINISMPKGTQKVDEWYNFVGQEIDSLLGGLGICEQRLIVSGYMPGGAVSPGYSEFIQRFELKDTSTGFCEAASDCLTTSTQNDLFMATSDGQSPSHSERILVHRGTLVSSSNVVMNKRQDKTIYGGVYGLQRLWASKFYGWLAEVRLQKCPKTY